MDEDEKRDAPEARANLCCRTNQPLCQNSCTTPNGVQSRWRTFLYDTKMDSGRPSQGKDKGDKRRISLRRRNTKFLKGFGRAEGLRPGLSKDESELAKHIVSATHFVAESGRMLGCKQDKMAFFEQEDFDLEQFSDGHMANLTEKGISTLKIDLATLQEKCEDEAQNAIHGSYSVFVEACEGIAEVDGQFQHLRVLVSGTTSLANELKRAIQSPVLRLGPDVADIPVGPSKELSNTAQISILRALEELDVAIAERDFPLAKKLLLECDQELEDVGTVGDVLSLECSVDERRETVVQLLESQLQDPTLATQDEHSLLQILSSVAGEVHALGYLLNLHSAQINSDLQQLPKPHRTGESENEGADYSGSLSRSSFHHIGLAVEDFRSVFGSNAAAPLCSILSQWADHEAKKCGEHIQANALSEFAGLSAVINTVAMSFIYAQSLKNSHSIDILPALRRVYWPSVEGFIGRFFETTGEEVVVMVHEEMSVLLTTSSPWDRHASPSSQAPLDSAQLIVDRIRYHCSILQPLWIPQICSPLRQGLRSLFGSFIEALASDVHEKIADGVPMQMIDRISEWLMTIIASLVEDLIPKELSSLEHKVGTIFTKREIQTFIDKAAQSFGLEQIQHVTDA